MPPLLAGVQFSPDGDSLVLATDTGLEWWDWRRGVRLVRFVGNSLAQTVSVGTEASVLTYTDASPTDARSALREYRCEVCSPIPDVLKLASRRVTRALTTEEEALFHAGSG